MRAMTGTTALKKNVALMHKQWPNRHHHVPPNAQLSAKKLPV